MATSSHTTPRRPRWMAVCASAALLLGSGLQQPAGAAPDPAVSAAPEPAVSAALPPGYEIVESTNSVTLNPGEHFFTFTSCPGGKFIWGGGASLSLEPSGGAPSLVTSGPSNAPPTQWVVNYVNIGGTATSFGVRVTAICANLSSSIHYVTLSSSAADLPPNSQTQLEVPCPGSSRIIAGGVVGPTTGQTRGGLELLANTNHGAGWGAVYVNGGDTTEPSFGYRVTAICADPDVTGFNTIQQQLATVVIAPGTNTIIPPLQCAGSPVSGGILVWSVSPSNVAPKLTVPEDGPIPASPGQTMWRFRLLNYGTTQLRVQYLVSVTCVS
jgi:hypothetical protein